MRIREDRKIDGGKLEPRATLSRNSVCVVVAPLMSLAAADPAAPAASSGRRRRARGVRATPYSTSGRRRDAQGTYTQTRLTYLLPLTFPGPVAPSTDFLWDFTPTTNQLEFMKGAYIHKHIPPIIKHHGFRRS